MLYTFSHDHLAALNMFLSPPVVCSCCCPAGPPPLHHCPASSALQSRRSHQAPSQPRPPPASGLHGGIDYKISPVCALPKAFPTRLNHHISYVINIFLLRPLVSPDWTGFKLVLLTSQMDEFVWCSQYSSYQPFPWAKGNPLQPCRVVKCFHFSPTAGVKEEAATQLRSTMAWLQFAPQTKSLWSAD